MEQLSSRGVYRNAWMSVREDAVRRDDGSEGIYGVIDKPHYALVIAQQGSAVHLVEQYRYPLGERRWEFPQGTAPGTDEPAAEALARRELREETGLTAGRMTLLGTVDVAPGMSSQRGRVFLATDLADGPPAREVEEQDMRSAWWERSDLEAAIAAGTFSDAQSLAAYALLLLRERTGDLDRP